MVDYSCKSVRGNDSSLRLYLDALERFKNLGNKKRVGETMANILDVYRERKNYPEAKKYLKPVIDLADTIGSLTFYNSLYLYLSQLYAEVGDYKKALEYYKKSKGYEDSLFDKKKIEEMATQELKYKYEKEQAIAQAEQEKKDLVIKEKQLRTRNIYIASAVGLCFVILFLYYRYRIKESLNKKLQNKNEIIQNEQKRSDQLLLNILPYKTAQELKEHGRAEPKLFNSVTVMFTDFKDFTRITEQSSPSALVDELDYCYKSFDQIIEKYNIEKIKTIGDSYMAAAGLPIEKNTNPSDTLNAALEIINFMNDLKLKRVKDQKLFFEIRIGIHTGPVVASIVGTKKFAYDIWGDTVNIASRMQSSGETGKINISGSTYELVKSTFTCIYRGKVLAKNKGEIDMYFVNQP